VMVVAAALVVASVVVAEMVVVVMAVVEVMVVEMVACGRGGGSGCGGDAVSASCWSGEFREDLSTNVTKRPKMFIYAKGLVVN